MNGVNPLNRNLKKNERLYKKPMNKFREIKPNLGRE
jgi:hypothetical protein